MLGRETIIHKKLCIKNKFTPRRQCYKTPHSILRIFSKYFRKKESLDKIRKYGENIRKTEIWSFTTLGQESERKEYSSM